MGDVAQILSGAREMLEAKAGRVVACSRVHYSPAWGFEAQQEFGNQVLVIETLLEPQQLLETIWTIETHYGRDRNAENLTKKQGQRYASRTLDIDILFYGDQIIDTEDLTVPHGLMAERSFVLEPLAEVMPEYCHPFFGQSVGQLLDNIYAKK